MKKLIFLFAGSELPFACKKDEGLKTCTGAAVAMHDGKAWTSVTVDKDKVPQQFWIVLNDTMLNSVPTGSPGDGNEYVHAYG